MAVEHMKYVSVLGPLKDFEPFVLKYVINGNVQLEPSYKHIDVKGLVPFEEENPLEHLKKRMRVLNEKMNASVRVYNKSTIQELSPEALDAQSLSKYVGKLEERLEETRREIEGYKTGIMERERIVSQIAPISSLEFNVEDLFHMEFFKFRFGSLPRENFSKQKEYLDNLDVIVIPLSDSGETMWIFYFMPEKSAPVVDNVFQALGFERIRISEKVKGGPKLNLEKFSQEITEMQKLISRSEANLARFIDEEKERFELDYNKVLYLSKVYEIKAMAAHTKETFFITGWMPVKNYKYFSKEMEPLEGILFTGEDPEDVKTSNPPTILHNKKFFKPFESLLTMYGLPVVKEFDPTILLTITFVFMFGFMFGDVGQGLLIALAGLYLFAVKKIQFGGIGLYVGLSSTFFGFVYGSVFGSEGILPPLWKAPLHGKDSINSILLFSLGYGVLIIIVTIIASMINSFKMRKWGRLLFDKNGLAGLMFYGGGAVCVLLSLLSGQIVFTEIALVVVVILPAIMIFFKEPLENILKRKKEILPHEKGLYLVEASFELFETVLSFMSNTVSFVRVGAFVLSHAGLSLAVWSLYGMMQGFGGIVVVIIGNALTIGLEGLIVAIQCMRLEYYEIFGRFYVGEGYDFKPVTVTED